MLHIYQLVTNPPLLLFLNAYKENSPQGRGEPLLPKELLKEGDIVFRRGTGFTSRVVLATVFAKYTGRCHEKV